MSVPRFILLMGPSGCGKSTIGPLLAERIGGVYLEGDDYHPPANKTKMGSGTPLTDEDRWPWFDILRAAVGDSLVARPDCPVILACSALKAKYRAYLLAGHEKSARTVFLRGTKDLIAGRLMDRRHEYMPAGLLQSQFEALEEPSPAEAAIVADIGGDPAAIAEWIACRLSPA